MNAAVQPMPAPYSPTPSQIAMAYSVCRSITRSAAKNFYYAFLVLPPAKRQALCAVYAFMRRCDDISDDGNLLPFERRQMLAGWEMKPSVVASGAEALAEMLREAARGHVGALRQRCSG